MADRLAFEEANKSRARMLFIGHRFIDISASVPERKSGTDFLLHPYLDDHSFGGAIRAENKFEDYATGRVTLEWISVDRGLFTAGWLVTSRAAWLLSWFPTGDLFVAHLDEVRALVRKEPARNVTTTAKNKGYLSWNTLEDMNYLVRNLPSARMVDLRTELGESFEHGSRLSPLLSSRKCSADELVRHMQLYPCESTPLQLTNLELQEIARGLAPKNLRKQVHEQMLSQLAWLK